jgi:hypothetical protein
MNRCNPSVTIGLLMLALAVLPGCAVTGAPSTAVAPCSVKAPASMQALTADGQALLAAPACHDRFEEYVSLALKRGESAPDAANRARFAELIAAAAKAGALTEHEAQRTYTRYFHTTFVSLPADYNVCSTLRDKKGLLAGLDTELEDKRRGMLVVAADRAGFQDAQRQHADLRLVLEALDLVCRDGR